MANSYLVRTPSSAGNRKTFTLSTWVKRSKMSYDYAYMITAGEYNSDQMGQFKFDASDNLNFSGYASNGSKDFRLHTNRVFRDPNAWYHVMVAVDTTQSTAADRVKMYVNGEQETSFAEATYPSQNHDTAFNLNGIQSNIGVRAGTGVFFEGSMSHVSIVDGAALAPTVFGETDSTSGIWKFKSPSATWGTNGVHLKFENSANLGLDSSGQTNNYTVNGNLKQSIDTPTTAYTTLNPLTHDSGGAKTYTNQNTTVSETADSWTTAHTGMMVTKGKWYFESKITYSNNQEAYVGACSQRTINERITNSHYLGQTTGSVGYYTNGGTYYKGAGAVSYGNSVSGGDIVGCALDLDNNFIYFSINGTWQNSGDPTSGASGTNGISLPSGMTSAGLKEISFSVSPNQSTHQCNFGNGLFGTTPISSAGSNGNGALFEYDVPSGYYAMNTKNLNTYG